MHENASEISVVKIFQSFHSLIDHFIIHKQWFTKVGLDLGYLMSYTTSTFPWN